MVVACLLALGLTVWVLVRAVRPAPGRRSTGVAVPHPSLPPAATTGDGQDGQVRPAREAFGGSSFRCRPLFFNRRADRVRLDCLVSGGGDAEAAGAPVSVDVGLPDAEWLAAAVANLLREWALDQQPLDMSIAASGNRVVLSNGDSTIRLPLHAAAGMSG